MKLMLRYTLRYKKLLLFDFISVFGFILIELGLPTILAMMIDKGIGNNDFTYVALLQFSNYLSNGRGDSR